MGNIKLLDCTLSDGGDINDWNFGTETITTSIEKLEKSQVDILEIGFLKDEPYKKDRTVYNDVSQLSKQILPKKDNLIYAAMIEVVNPLPLEKLAPCSEKTIDMISCIIEKKFLKENFEYCKGIVEKGYKLSVQPACVDQYSYQEFIEMIEMFNAIQPDIFYIVDSFGTQTIQTLMPYMELADKHFKKGLSLGYHGHNNMMQAFEVAKVFCEMKTERDMYIDASVYGMGRGASNLNLELFAEYLNKFHGKNYNIEPMLHVYDKYLKPIYDTCPWGYSLPYYLTAINNCNPNYASYYDIDLKVPSEDIEAILHILSEEDKIIYTKEKADEYLRIYRKNQLKLAIIVPVHNKPEIVRYYIERKAEIYRNHGIDLIFYDDSNNDEIKDIVNLYRYDNVRYHRYCGEFDKTTIDIKVFSAAKEFMNKYDYIWICRDRSLPNIEIIYNNLCALSKQNMDFIIVYPHWIESHHHGEKIFTDCCELAEDLFGEMTSLGSIIFTSKTLNNIVNNHQVDKVKNYGLWLPVSLFHYITDIKFKACFLVNNSFSFAPTYTSSFWFKNNSLLWLFGERWEKIITLLPKEYNSVKKEIFTFKNWTFPPFRKNFMLSTRAGGGLKFKDIINYRKYLKSNIACPLKKMYIISLLPSSFCKHYMEKPNSFICRLSMQAYKILFKIKRFIQYLFSDLKNIFSKQEMQKYSGHDYSQFINSFEQIKGIDSYLLHGSLENVRHPWLTIIIPTYNRVELLKDALDSIFRQKEVNFEWDVIVIDNAKYDGKANETQKFIENLNYPKLIYYRNEDNLGICGNMNRGVEIARGQWVSLLHDDDLLVNNYLFKIEKLINKYDKKKGKPLGHIAASYEMFTGGSLVNHAYVRNFIIERNFYLCSTLSNNSLYVTEKSSLPIIGAINLCPPSNGALFRKKAYIECGGMDGGGFVTSDVILYYNMMSKYSVYKSKEILGFYRWFNNETSTKLHKVFNDLYDFREFAYRQNKVYRLFGFMFRQEHFVHEFFAIAPMGGEINEKSILAFNDIVNFKPNQTRNFVFCVVRKIYLYIQRTKSKQISNQLSKV